MLNTCFGNFEVLQDGPKDLLFGLDVESNRSAVHSALLCLRSQVLCSMGVYKKP